MRRSIGRSITSLLCSASIVVVTGCGSAAREREDVAAGSVSAPASAAVQRPIEEFVEAQGTYCVLLDGPDCVLFEPPVRNILGWIKIQDGVRRYARVDYAGLADRYLEGALGTTFAGGITERPLADGRAEVTVRLHTRNALAWVWGRQVLADGYGPNHRLWGTDATDVEAGATPSLVESDFTLVFYNPRVGAPIPDLTQFAFDTSYAADARVREAIVAHGPGVLTQAAEDLGVGPAGATAQLVLHQLGLFEVYADVSDGGDAPPREHGIRNAEGWPVELLNLVPRGR